MVVCPSCRTVNTEEATACANCGVSLEPGYASLMPVRRSESERPPLEIQPPKPPSKWRPVVMLGILLVAVAALSGAYLLRPDPCEGANFESQNFGYCIFVPEGWRASEARFGADVVLDQFAPPTESTTVLVEAVDLESGAALEDWAATVLQKDEGIGLTPGAASQTELGGVPALQWEVTSTDGEESFRMREVVAVRGDVGWRIALSDQADGFGTSAVVFQDMLESWRFQ
jgi:hypothetical protein